MSSSVNSGKSSRICSWVRPAASQEHIRNRNPHVADARTAAALARLDGDDVLVVHGQILASFWARCSKLSPSISSIPASRPTARALPIVGPARMPRERLADTARAGSADNLRTPRCLVAAHRQLQEPSGCRPRGLTDAAHAMECRDGDPALFFGKGGLDLCQNVITPEEKTWNGDGDIGKRARFARKRDRSLRKISRWFGDPRKRNWSGRHYCRFHKGCEPGA
jgi:hypothetical protein